MVSLHVKAFETRPCSDVCRNHPVHRLGRCLSTPTSKVISCHIQTCTTISTSTPLQMGKCAQLLLPSKVWIGVSGRCCAIVATTWCLSGYCQTIRRRGGELIEKSAVAFTNIPEADPTSTECSNIQLCPAQVSIRTLLQHQTGRGTLCLTEAPTFEAVVKT